MFSSARDEIAAYMSATFAPEMRDEISASFMVLDAFSYQDLEDELSDILNDLDADDTDLTQEKFVACINKHLLKLLSCHQILIDEDASISLKNQILAVLFRIQTIEDPTPILRLLESSHPNEVKFAKTVEEFSEATETEVLEALVSIDEKFLINLMTHLYAIEEAIENEEFINPSPEQKNLKENLKDFFAVHGNECLGFEMIYNGIEPGLSIKIYYPYIKDNIIVDDDLVTAKNILSLFLMSKDTFTDPLGIYTKYSEQLIHNADRILKIEVKIGELLSKLHQYQEAKNVARSVSVIQH